MSELPIKATLKAGGGYDAPWLTIDAADENDLATRLYNLVHHEAALQLVVEAANALKAVNNAAPITAPAAAPAVPEQATPAPGWATGPQQTQQLNPQGQYAQTPPVQQGPRLHPTDVCQLCGQRPQEKDVYRKADNKKFEFWACPNQAKRDDGHYSEFRN